MTKGKNTTNCPNLNEIRAATRESLNFEKRAELLDSFVKDKLLELENLSPVVRIRVGGLRLIQGQHNELEARYFEERAALEAKYQKLYEPLYKIRCEIVNGDTDVVVRCACHKVVTKVDGVTGYSTTEEEVKGVPNFWLSAMKSNEILAKEISERDEGALKFLNDIKYSKFDDPKGFKLDFYFDTNPYFKNSVLSKVYHMIDEVECVLEKSTGTKIEWLPGKCLTQKILKKRPEEGSKIAKPMTKTETCESFFKYFNPPQIPGDEEELDEDAAEELQCQMEQDYEIGETIRDYIIPHAVSWFTGEAALGDDFENLEDDNDDDDEDDVDDDDDDDDEDETKIVKKKGGIVPNENGQQGGQPPECKAQ